MKITKSQLKQLIKEEMENVLKETQAFQSKRDRLSIKKPGVHKVVRTKMDRGKEPLNPGAVDVGEKYVRTREDGKDIIIDKNTYDSLGAAEKLEFVPWTGTEVEKDMKTGKETRTKFVQPADTRYGQLDPTRQMS